MKSKAKSGDTVSVHYKGSLSDGTVFDSSADREPLEFTLGNQMVIPGFEQAVIGMNVGESLTTTIESESAYGPYREDLKVELPLDQVPEDMNPQVGEDLQLETPTGSQISARVLDVSESGLTIDANHPLAGEDLTFEIELISISDVA